MLSLLGRDNFIQALHGANSGWWTQMKLKQAKFPLAGCFLLISGRKWLEFYNRNFDSIVLVLIVIRPLCIVIHVCVVNYSKA